ncbi:hypothetical protein [Nguyenibacter vanlangensis]|uniref:Uncharacterized protein n=1 Tax=Nguyenibacter vanlangensis TaxID=1216886 RepID=A0A7Y7M3H2_9PROT|nr:hypothetical protein [Nguyenibacter vanlangensis]NVN09700.1 hypothetical protein [Nguyenibacter vanlangensis]
MQTLLLDRTTWDLVSDASGNIAVASEPYSLAQDASSYVRTFSNECWFNQDLGIPFFAQILGYLPPANLVRSYIISNAEQVPDVASAQCFFTAFNARALSGQIQITSVTGATASVGF